MNLSGRPIPTKGESPFKSKRVRDAARDERCTLRLSCCNGDTATTVLAHLRLFSWAGMGQKPPDFLGVFACMACHDAIDGRRNDAAFGFDDLLRALGETLTKQFACGNFTSRN